MKVLHTQLGYDGKALQFLFLKTAGLWSFFNSLDFCQFTDLLYWQVSVIVLEEELC